MILRVTILFAVITLVYSEIYRLPNHVKPSRYHLTIEPHLRDSNPMEFEGSVAMDLKILQNTKNIILNQLNLTIDNSNLSIISSKGEDVKVAATSTNNEKQIYTIELEEELVKDEVYTLKIGNFTGILRKLRGFFSGFYNETKTSSFAATHFETSSARTTFPCFDEPIFKASFIVSIIRKSDYNSVSNENLAKTEDLGDGRFKDTFKETPLMSTYTLAFAVTNFKASEKIDRQRIFARPQAIDNEEWKYSLDIANRTLWALEEYTGIDYVMDKIDHLAVPNQYFEPRAMENWGLIVYGETHLLRDNKSLAADYQRTTCMITHEIAHQWFGNLVTPTWWGYMWISEGFAMYFQFRIANILQPTWRLKEQFLISSCQEALAADIAVGTHALNLDFNRLDQLMLNSIVYLKGSCIVRMMEHFLTDDILRNGLQIYLEKNKFGNTGPSDIYDALQEAVDTAGRNNLLGNMTVAQIMQTWDSNKGFPIITVKRDYKTGSITLKQETTIQKDSNITTTTWNVPINYVFSANGKLDFASTTADYWLTESEATINNNFPTDGWVIVNKQEMGYYRVNYDLENWERIIKVLKSDEFESIDVLNRAQLIDDAFHLASNSKLPWDIPLRLGEYLIRETDYIAFSPFYRGLSGILKFPNLVGVDFYDILTKGRNLTKLEVTKEYIKKTLSGVKDTLGFRTKEDDTHLDQIHRDEFRTFVRYFKDT